MSENCKRAGYHIIQKIGKTLKINQGWEIIEKNDILIAEDKLISFIVDKTKRILYMNPRQIQLDAGRLKTSKMRIKKRIEKEK